VVNPANRKAGVGKLLVAELSHIAGDALRLWSHGDLDGAATLANKLGFKRVRTLLQLRRSLEMPLPAIDIPSSVTLRPLQDNDIDEWLGVNARSFAHHPEQRIWSVRDVQLRMQEPWFDRNGFLVAFENKKMIGFCWTKVHGSASGHGHVPLGEIYVIGVDPSAQGRGLGRQLTLAGLSHLRNNGIRTAMLYVESDNTAANAMYQRLGFAEWAIDVMYRR
jgi:mycothiol synthase